MNDHAFARRVARRLRREINNLLFRKARGYLPPSMDLNTAFAAIRSTSPLAVLDIGANSGQFGRSLRCSGFDGRIISFEPQVTPFELLKSAADVDPLWDCHRIALGDQQGRLDMHVSGQSVSSSLLPIGAKHVELMPNSAEVGIETVDVERLDSWLTGHPDLANGPLFLKLDTQGYEIPIIRGTTGVIDVVCGVMAEVLFSNLYEGQTRYYEVMHFLDNAGFIFHGLYDVQVDPVTGSYLWGDLVYIRPRTVEGSLWFPQRKCRS